MKEDQSEGNRRDNEEKGRVKGWVGCKRIK